MTDTTYFANLEVTDTGFRVICMQEKNGFKAVTEIIEADTTDFDIPAIVRVFRNYMQTEGVTTASQLTVKWHYDAGKATTLAGHLLKALQQAPAKETA